MARINVEEKWWRDGRRKMLIAIVGSDILADGLALNFWRLAQEYWVPKKQGIPNKIYHKALPHAQALIDCDIAVEHEGMIYAKGGKKQFTWMIDRLAAASRAGKASAKRKNTKNATSENSQNDENLSIQITPSEIADFNNLHQRQANQTPTKRQPNANPPYSLLISHYSKIQEGESKKALSSSAEPTHPLMVIWNENCGELAKVKKSTSTRLRKSARVWPECSSEEWVAIVQRIAKSSFCQGKNDRGWVATYDWLCQPETHLKVAEGKYDNRSGAGGAQNWDYVFGGSK